MLEAAQSKPATTCMSLMITTTYVYEYISYFTASFYKTDSPVMAVSQPFLPQTTPTSSPYFHKVTRRNLSFELSNEKGEQKSERPSDKKLTPRDHSMSGRETLGPRKAAIFARRRLPLGDVQSHDSTLKDYLTFDEPLNREG